MSYHHTRQEFPAPFRRSAPAGCWGSGTASKRAAQVNHVTNVWLQIFFLNIVFFFFLFFISGMYLLCA